MAVAMPEKRPPPPELSRPVMVDSLAVDRDSVFDIHSSAEERALLARRFDLVALESLSAGVAATRTEAGEMRLSGRLKAVVVQTCVVTLEPVRSTIEADFDRVFSPRATLEEKEDVFLALEGEDPPEPLEGGTVDAGEVVAETLGLALNPFPRAPGATLPAGAATTGETGDTPEKSGPFAVLAKLKERR